MSLLGRKESAPAAQIPASFQLGILIDPQYAQFKRDFLAVVDEKVIGVIHYDPSFTMLVNGVLSRGDSVREFAGERYVDDRYVEIIFRVGRRYLPFKPEDKIASLEKMPHKSIVYVDRKLFLETLRGIRAQMISDGTRNEYVLRGFDEFVLNAEVCGGLPKGARFLYDDRPKPSLFSF